MLTTLIGCNEGNVGSESSTITKEEAYTLYYNLIEKFVPELMSEPQESDIDIETRDEVTYLDVHFVRNTKVKIQSQNVDGKLQYYLLNEFADADKYNFYLINDDKFYSVSAKLNELGEIKEQPASMISTYLFTYLNTPLFAQDAIISMTTEKKDSNSQITLMLDGTKMEYGYPQKVMLEIGADYDNNLDDVKIVLTIDDNGTPIDMSTEISMSILDDEGELAAKKTLNMKFTFNKLDDVNFNLQEILSRYTADTSIIE